MYQLNVIFFYLKTIASNNMTTIFYTCIKNTRILPLKKRCYMIDIIKKYYTTRAWRYIVSFYKCRTRRVVCCKCIHVFHIPGVLKLGADRPVDASRTLRPHNQLFHRSRDAHDRRQRFPGRFTMRLGSSYRLTSPQIYITPLIDMDVTSQIISTVTI